MTAATGQPPAQRKHGTVETPVETGTVETVVEAPAGTAETVVETPAGTAETVVETPVGTGALVLAEPAGVARALVVLGHGAGGGPTAPDLALVAAALVDWGAVVIRTVQPYRRAGRRAPPPPKQLDAAFEAMVAVARQGRGELPVVVGGRSNGARVACRTAGAVGAAGLLALAFPLHPPGRPTLSRRPELLAAGVPVLVLQGERDAFGTPEALRAGPDPLPAAVQVLAVPGGDHALRRGLRPLLPGVVAWVGRIVAPLVAGS